MTDAPPRPAPTVRMTLRQVPASTGLAWVREGWSVWRRYPVAFMALPMAFLFTAMLLALLVPYLGGALGLALLPMLTLGSALAGRAASEGRMPHVGMLAEGWLVRDAARRKAQAMLGLLSMAGALATFWIANVVDGGTFVELQRALAAAAADDAPPEAAKRVQQLFDDPALARGWWVRMAGSALLMVPFWHAPTLVHLHGQGAAQSLFSSTLAVLRNGRAFVVYGLAWAGAAALGAALVSVLAGVAGSRGLASAAALLAMAAVTSAFYASLWFTTRDSFARWEGAAPAPSAVTIDAP